MGNGETPYTYRVQYDYYVKNLRSPRGHLKGPEPLWPPVEKVTKAIKEMPLKISVSQYSENLSWGEHALSWIGKVCKEGEALRVVDIVN